MNTSKGSIKDWPLGLLRGNVYLAVTNLSNISEIDILRNIFSVDVNE